MNILLQFITVAALFVALDAIWLKSTSSFYNKQLRAFLAPKPDLRPAALFYVLYVIAILVFALAPALEQNSLWYAVSHAAFLGLVMFATYDLTNQATMKKWPVVVTLVDMAWGTCSTTLVTVLAFLILN